MIRAPKVLAVLGLSFLATSTASAQCTDGTPPPCDARKPVQPTVIRREPPAAADRARKFLVLPFRNVTRQADHEWLVEGSTTMLVEALGRWQGITVVPDEKLYPALKRAGIVPGTVADADKVRRVADETGGWTAVTGEVLATGGRLRITARAWDVPTSRELVRASSEIAAGGDVRAAYDSVSLTLLHSAGFDSVTTDLATTTTRNLDAYRAHLGGLAHMRRSEVKPALKDFQEAVRLDSNFAMAWAHLAEMTLSLEPNSIMNPLSNAAKYSARAVALSSKLPARQRQLVLANDAIFQAQFTDARHILEVLVAADSNDFEAATALIGLEMFDPILIDVPGGQRPRGSMNRAARLAKRIALLDPTRHAMFGLLSAIYAQAGVPGVTPTLGIDRQPASFPDLMATVRQREHTRIYYPILRDSIVLVPADSLAMIPKDSLKAMRKESRAAAKQWAERWTASAADESAPYALAAELHAYDHEYPEALGSLAKAESLGMQTAWSVPAKRMVYLARNGNLAPAIRLADSLTTANFFANPNNALINGDAVIWAFTLHIVANRLPRAGTLIDQAIATRRMFSAVNAETGGFGMVMGNEDPDEEPGVPRSMRGMQLDTILAHLSDVVASPQVGQWIPIMLPMLAEAADTTKRRLPSLLKAADAIAASGKPQLAFQLASNAVVSDSTLEPEAATFAWYRTGAEAFNAVKRATAARFHAGSATVAGDRAVFEWAAADSAPFTLHRAETPPGRGEYRWEVTVDVGGRYYRLSTSVPGRAPNATPKTATLPELLGPTSTSTVSTGALVGRIQKDTTVLQTMTLRTEVAPGVIRMVVTDKAFLDALRAAKPAEAPFKFTPCVRPLGSKGAPECVTGTARITYP